MVAARPVHVTVLELLGQGRAHLGDLDREVERFAGERMPTWIIRRGSTSPSVIA